MQIIRGLDSTAFSKVVLTIGNFDGVHLGHQAILRAARVKADAAGTRLVAMTFDPHPAAILKPDQVPPTLTPGEEKERQLAACGVDSVVIVRSTPEFFRTPADAFVHESIFTRFQPVAVVEGESFHYGQRAQGNVHTLREAAGRYGFEVEIVPPVLATLVGQKDKPVSSSLIRGFISSGAMDQAALCLGRPYALLGTVVPGDARGRKLGFPTANLQPAPQLIPAEGVYAGRTSLDGQCIAAAISIGVNPTFAGRELRVEAFLLDFEGELYDRPLRLEFLAWLRPQEKFASLEALQEQIELDVRQVRQVAAQSI